MVLIQYLRRGPQSDPRAVLLGFVLIACAIALYRRLLCRPRTQAPVSVNYHFTRRCNKTCGFCFHTATTSFCLPDARAKQGLARLKAAGMRKINFAGGEPFLYPSFLGGMVEFCKTQLSLESVSIVTNGSLVKRDFLTRYGQYIDILAVSCDSFDEATNVQIGRGGGDQVTKLFQIASWCREFNIKFKLNTVVCKLNYREDMNAAIKSLRPFRWKCFQVLLVAGENDSNTTLRDVRKFQISDDEYEGFCQRHRHHPCFVAEPNVLMAKSYLILDEYMRFLSRDGQSPSDPILDVPVSTALAQVYWDKQSFVKRGGFYDWSKEPTSPGCGTKNNKELEW